MKKKTKAIMQILLMLVMAVLFAFVPISYMQQVIRTNLATVEPSQLEQYEKKSIALDSEDYNIVSNIIMWERHQAASDEPSGDYVTAFYPMSATSAVLLIKMQMEGQTTNGVVSRKQHRERY